MALPPPPPYPPPKPVGLGSVQLALDRARLRELTAIKAGNPGIRKRVKLEDLRFLGNEVELPANPETFQMNFKPVFNKTEIRGLGFEPVTFDHTANPVLEMSFVLNAVNLETPELRGPERIKQILAFFQSLCYPEEHGSGLFLFEPELRITWPGFMSMDAAILDLTVDVILWTHEPIPLPRYVRVDLEMEERRSDKIFASTIIGNDLSPGSGFFMAEAGVFRLPEGP